MPPLERDEEVKEGKEIKMFNSKQTFIYTSNIINTNKSWK